MKESTAITKEGERKKELLTTKSDKCVHHAQEGPGKQLGSLRSVINTIARNGSAPSIESIATELSGMHTAERASVLLGLQQTHGNRYVQRVVIGIQAKLKVGQPGDIYEQEADRVAEQVMRTAEPGVQRQAEEEEELVQTKSIAEQNTPLAQRQVEEGEEEGLVQPKLVANTEYYSIQRQVDDEEDEEEFLQTKELTGHNAEIIPDLEFRIQAIRGGGEPLPESVRTYFEPRFSHDFSRVRVHTDSKAAESARAVNARAFTVGQNMVFGAGEYMPETMEGKTLLAPN